MIFKIKNTKFANYRGAYLDVEFSVEKRVYVPGEPIRGNITIDNKLVHFIFLSNFNSTLDLANLSNMLFCTSNKKQFVTLPDQKSIFTKVPPIQPEWDCLNLK